MAVRAKKKCYFCSQSIDLVDYKDARLLSRYVNSYGKIDARKRSGNCARHQRMVANAIKRSRLAALMPFATR
jgi:small subunit ribosomal protein S18